MEFGKRGDLADVDFSLPDPDPRSVALLARSAPGAVAVRIGTPTWTHDSLHIGPVPARARLASYAARFSTIELNATFHAVPELRTVATWASTVPRHFRFAPKVPRAVSHDGGPWRAEAARFAEVLAQFGDTLGASFFQAPPHAGPDDEGELFARVAAVPGTALELRHPAFFRRGTLDDRVFDRMVHEHVGTVVTDTPGRRDVVHSTLTSPRLLLRFMADAQDPTTAPRLAAWAERVRWWGARGLREVYVFVHHRDNLHLPELADLARVAFGEMCVETEPPRQAGLFG